MKTTDFSAPRRMSRSAFAIFFAGSLKKYIEVFLVVTVLNLSISEIERTMMENITIILAVLGGCIVLAALTAFTKYYFRKYFVEDGNLIFIHGMLQKETTSIPLRKIHSLRTKRGPMYRLLDMTGVSFDTLASKSSEIDLVLDNDDWQALLDRVNTQEDQEPVTTDRPETTVRPGNLNLIKGAFCQNHLKGMAILLAILGAIYNQVISVSEDAVRYFIEYAESLSFSFSAAIVIVVAVYVIILLLWIGRIFVRYYDMVIRIDRKQMFFESGLFSRNSSRFSFDKVCTVYVKQNIFERFLGCHTIMMRQALNATDEKKDTDVRIYGYESPALFLNWWLGKDYEASEEIVSARSGYGVFGYAVRFDVLVSVGSAVALYLLGYYIWIVVPAAYLLVAGLKGFLAVGRSYISLKEDYILISEGKFADIRNYAKYNNVEVVRLKATPLTPLFHRVRLTISTNGTSFTVRSLKEDEARDIYERLLASVAASRP